MFEFINIKQNTDEWHNLRCGKVTSSNLKVIMANYGKAFGEPAKKYAKQIALERITGIKSRSSYTNEAMQRGHDEEPLARMLYEQELFCEVNNGGFFNSDFVGCSPDGLIGDNGVIEIKSADSHIHYDRVAKASYDSGYKWQLIGNMKFPERQWIDFVSYCSEYPEGQKLYVCRLQASNFADEYKMIDVRIEEFKRLVDKCEAGILNSNYFNL